MGEIIIPKFKIGDKIKNKKTNKIYTVDLILYMGEKICCYKITDNENLKSSLYTEFEDEYELI